MQPTRVQLIAATVFLLATRPAMAAHGPGFSGAGFAGSPTTISATTMGRGQWYLQALVEQQEFDRFSEEELLEFSEQGKEDVHDTESISTTAVSIAHGVTPVFTVSLRIPYVVRKDTRQLPHAHEEEEEEGGGHGHAIDELGDSRGLGDLLAFGQWNLVSLPEVGTEAALLFGLEMPTGDTDIKTAEGERFEAELQPGSGSWDPMLGFAVSQRMGRTSVHGNLLYTFSTEGTQSTRLGDVLNYNAALSYALLSGPVNLDLSLEGNGVFRQKAEISGHAEPNSGGNIILLSPGVGLGYGPLSASFSFGFPVLQDLNGVQNDLDSRLLFSLGLSL